jgi:hypothetical protein
MSVDTRIHIGALLNLPPLENLHLAWIPFPGTDELATTGRNA